MTVFISSTYKDLIDYRIAVIRAVEGTNYQASKMEVFGARPDEPVDACLKEVEESELFIGIYALRYGFIPEGADISITEMEYLHAKKFGKPIYCFILDEENQPWLKKWIEGEPGKSKLESFKQRIQKVHICDYFTTADDLRAKVSNALSHFAANHQPINRQSENTSQKPFTGSTLPNQSYFFGREEELENIADAINPPTPTWGVLIHGEGGIGKTALAIEAAHRAPSTNFKIKIFVSAKERELTSKGEISSKEFSQDSYFSILNEIALQLGEEGIPRLAPDERANALNHVLKTKKTLLILDNLETLNNDDRDYLYQFLTHLPHGNKAIVTNRRRDDIDGRAIRLDKLPRAEAERLISELVKRNPRLHDIKDIEKEELYYAASGNPLIIRWLIGQVGRVGTEIKTITEAITFLKNAPQNNDPLEYVFGDLLNSLIPREKVVLAVMVYLSLSPKIEWIAKITDYNEKEIEMIWEELVNRSILVNIKDSKSCSLPYITRQFIKNKLPREIFDAEGKLAHYAYRIVLEFGGRKNIQEQEYLENNWPPILASLSHFIKHDNEKLQIICDALDTFFSSSQLLDEWLWLNQQAEIVALANFDYDNAGARAYKVGLIYSYRGQAAEVLQYAKRAENNWSELYFTKTSYNSTKPLVNYLRAIGYRLEKNYVRAIEEINNAIKFWKSFTPEGIDIADAYNMLGEIQIDMGEVGDSGEHYSNAEKSFSEALRIANKISYKEVKPKYTGNLAKLAIKCGDWAKVIILANEALKEAENMGYQEEIARENFFLASAYLQLGYSGDKGLEASREAFKIYTRLKHKDLPLAEKVLEQWKRRTGRRI
jgi:tetratricopeptide (TPR) repeat protein